VLVTTDGSFGDIERSSYIPAEERVVYELKESKKPFVIVLNVKDVKNKESAELKNSLEDKYGVPVVTVNAEEMDVDEINEILEKVLFEFPIRSIGVNLPSWLQALPDSNELIREITGGLRSATENMSKMKDFAYLSENFALNGKIDTPVVESVNLADGTVEYTLNANPSLFYEVLSSECGDEIKDDYELLSYVKSLAKAKSEYKRLKNALELAEETGYGIVCPDDGKLSVDEPVLTKQGNKYGVKFRATAPSLHILKVDLSTEISPIVGSEEQSEELVEKLCASYENDPKSILSTNIFGKTLNELITDGLNKKAENISDETRGKMRKTVTRITNESKGGVICILL
ncbi:MAG: stage IV sporulation protein A, partial [Clostridia bacterium]|nr:stage IV sporulation protein A [Clostridia bacterium]